MSTLAQRMIGVMRLDAATFEEVEHDAGANVQAGVVVAVAVIVRVAELSLDADPTLDVEPRSLIIGGALAAAFGMLLWPLVAGMTWLIGTRWLPGRQTEANYGQLLRVTGFSYAPHVMAIGALLPVVGIVVFHLANVWAFVAFVIGVKHALDYEHIVRAALVCLLAALIQLL